MLTLGTVATFTVYLILAVVLNIADNVEAEPAAEGEQASSESTTDPASTPEGGTTPTAPGSVTPITPTTTAPAAPTPTPPAGG